SIRLIDTTEAFAALGGQWNELLERSARPNIFLTHEWLFTWWEVYGRGKQLSILLCCEDNGELLGILPFYIEKRGLLPKVNVLRFLGSEGVTSEFLECIAAKGKERRVYDAVFGHLQREKTRWDIVECANVETGTQFDQYLREQCASGIQVEANGTHGKCPYAELPGSREAFMKSLSFKTRKRTRYFRNALAKRGEVSVYTSCDARRLGSDLDDAIGLYRANMSRRGWKEKFSSGEYMAFYRKICERFLALGRLQLSFLQVNGGRAAFLNSFKYQNRIYAYHTGFDETWRDYSVGFVLLGHLLEKAVGEGFTHFEFLRGGQRYKYHWAITGERELADVMLSGGSPSGRLYRLKCSALSASKGMLRKVAPAGAIEFARKVFAHRI
ncbi:MAG TPA: GNAT family N-acetyltransferase, partial [Dissulfurispiraceae bacterium]